MQVEADEVVAPGADGLFGVRPGHIAYLATMQPGLLTVKEGAKEQRYFVAGGFVEVADDTVRVLADVAEAIESIDVAEAKKRVETADAKLLEISPSLPAYELQRDAARTAKVRYELASKR